MEERNVDEAAIAAEETKCNIDLDVAKEEATWYSIMNVLALSCGSGMGIPFDKAEAEQFTKRFPLKNPLPLKAFFKSGDPALNRNFEERNLETWRWQPDSFDKTLAPQAQGWAIIAETECAKFFGIPQSIEAISEDLREQWMAYGMMLNFIAQKQCEFAFENIRNDEGLFVEACEFGSVNVIDSANNLEDQVCMLWACSDLAQFLGQSKSVFQDKEVQQKFLKFADDLFLAIAANKDSLLETSENKILAQSVAIPALIWYADATQAQELRANCLWMMRGFADNLVRAQDNNEMVGDNLMDAAAALRALTDAFRVTKLRTYAECAMKIFDTMEANWAKIPGVYPQVPLSPEYTFNADDVGTILGALNSSRLFLKERIDGGLAELRMRVFLCRAVNASGFQMSMPSFDFLPDWLQQREPTSHFRHISIPLPSQAGGEFGIAPVFAGEISYDPQSDTWARNVIFDAPAAMRSCCEMLWLNRETINGFPDISFEEAPLAVRQAAGIES